MSAFEIPAIRECSANQHPARSLNVHGVVSLAHNEVNWTLALPENLADNTLSIYCPGYLAIKKTSRPMRHALAAAGVATLSYEPAREDGGSWLGSSDPQQLHADTVASLVSAVQPVIGAYHDQKGDRLQQEKVRLIAHSMGGLAAVRYATMQPDRVTNIIGLAAVGFGHPTVTELLGDVSGGILASLQHEIFPIWKEGSFVFGRKTLLQVMHYYARLRFLQEGLSCLTEDIRGTVGRLAQKGIPYSYRAFEHDILVRPDPSIADHVENFAVIPDAGHLFPIKRPARVVQSIWPVL